MKETLIWNVEKGLELKATDLSLAESQRSIVDQNVAEFFEKYDHPMYKRLGSLAKKMGGHGGMDFMMLYRIIECLRNGQALDQNVYEGCFWSAVAPLSEASVVQEGLPQKFPDFTRGNWKITKPLGIIS